MTPDSLAAAARNLDFLPPDLRVHLLIVVVMAYAMVMNGWFYR